MLRKYVGFKRAFLVGVSLSAILPATALGNEVLPSEIREDGTRLYRPPVFDALSLRTARDMLAEIPGFTINGGGGGRGLGQGGANVLINGERVASKQSGPLDVLSRTSPDSVIRIEIADAGAFGVPGLSGDVANVIVRRGAFSGNWKWEPRFHGGSKPSYRNGEASISGSFGKLDYALGFEIENPLDSFVGPEIVRDGTGEVIERRQEEKTFGRESHEYTATLGYELAANARANVNLSYREQEFPQSEERFGFLTDGSQTYRLQNSLNDEDGFEIGGDVTFEAFGLTTKLIAIVSEDSELPFDEALDAVDGAFVERSQFFNGIDTSENILRGETSFDFAGGPLQLAAERTFNTLKSEGAFSTIDEGGNVLTVIGFGPTEVEELRYDGSVAWSRDLGDIWSVQGSIGAEQSEITLPGTGAPARTFFRPKGYAQLTYSPTEMLDWRVRVERRVRQLNFFDFVSSVDLGQDQQTAGNAQIVPPQSWFGRIEVDRRFDNGSVISARIFGERAEDFIERLPIDTDNDGVFDTDGPGNIDSSSFIGAGLDSTLVTDDFGIPGGELELSGRVFSSKVIDPLTGEERGRSGRPAHQYEVRFQQDIPDTDLRYGFGIENNRQNRSFSFNQTSLNTRDPYADMFLEHRDFHGLTLRASLGNLFDRAFNFDREVLDGPRGVGDVVLVEKRTRGTGPQFRLSIGGAF